MNILRWVSGHPKTDRVARAARYILESGAHGTAAHYNMQAVRDTIRQWAGIPDFTVAEAIETVNRIRAQRGWTPVAEHEYRSDDPDIPTKYCSRCDFFHNGRAC